MNELKAMFPFRKEFMQYLQDRYDLTTLKGAKDYFAQNSNVVPKLKTMQNAWGFFQALKDTMLTSDHVEVTGSRLPWTIEEAFPRQKKVVGKLAKELGLTYMDDLKRYIAVEGKITVRGVGKMFIQRAQDKQAPNGSWFSFSLSEAGPFSARTLANDSSDKAKSVGELIHILVMSDLSNEELDNVFRIVTSIRKKP